MTTSTSNSVSKFVDNLNNITSDYKYTPSEPLIYGSLGFNSMAIVVGNNQTNVNNFFATFNAKNTLPTDWTTLMNSFYQFATAPGGGYDINSINNSGIFGSNPSQTQIVNSLVNNFANLDFSAAVNGPPSLDTVGIAPANPNYPSQFQAWYKQFATSYNYSGTSTFIQNFENALTTTAALQRGTALFAPGGGPIPNSSSIPRYEDVFMSFFPSATHAQFVTYMQSYYNLQVKNNGYFVPSMSFKDFTQGVITLANSNNSIDYGISSLASIGSSKTQILDVIYAMVGSVLSSLQNVAASQAGRLNIFSQWQTAYTSLIKQVHTFLQGEPGVRIAIDAKDSLGNDVAGGVKDANTTRAILNDKYNSAIQNLLSSQQASIGDDAKALQSNINSSTDAVSQQTNLSSAIIQELTSLLHAIFKK